MMYKKKTNCGYIALVSVIVISFTISIIVFTLNLKGFFVRFNILESELKEMSLTYAANCRDIALYKLKINNAYVPAEGGDTVLISLPSQAETCIIREIVDEGGELLIRTEGVKNNAQTNLETLVTQTGDNFSVVSSKEVQSFD